MVHEKMEQSILWKNEVIMKKTILPLLVVAFLAACSDSNPDVNFVAPLSQVAENSSSSESAPVVAESSSSVATVPSLSSAALPANSSAAVPPVVPASSSAAVPPVQPGDRVPTLTERDPNLEYTFYGAELTGIDQFHYGRYEVRMKMAAISGTVSSMFLYYDNSWEKGEEPWNEIDIEILGKDPSKWQSNIITREGDPSINKQTSSEVIHPFNFDATQEFHLYAIIWTPEYVSWEIDSVEVRRDTLGLTHGTHADADQVKFLTKEQSLRFNLWASKTPSWTGKFTGVGLPIEQHIDYVRVYSYDEATKTFTKLWQDDFDGEDLDPQHWRAGDWVMENVQYRVDNIKVEDGVCKLIMDYEAS